MSDRKSIARYRSNLQGEVDGAALYRALAAAEGDPRLADVFNRLAAVEEAHADFWRRRLAAAGAAVTLRPSPRVRILAWLARRFGTAFVLPAITATEVQSSAVYDDQPEARTAGMAEDERSHARLMQAAAGRDGLAGPTLAMLEGRHRGGGGNALRAAVLGANDGLVSNLSLVMGMAGLAADERTVLLAGLAGLVAGAGSMAMGEWLSVTSARELYQSQIATEAAELKAVPEEEKQELVLIYQAKGLGEAQARALADRLMADEKTALDTLAREELGVDPDELGGSAGAAALSSFLLFALGAIFPVAPYMLLQGQAAFIGALASSGLALVLVGAGTSLFTGRPVTLSALRQLLIGLAAAGLTYGLGRAAGVLVG
ncbi:VIT1/CCC1 transporter family protein [Oleisolibacter albus]|uniref:VIT1/CCC1 transporter family protein n=1 Tax=Oleisolibacter albus TaxID=2171757 RepID=UPI000DF497FD|nr:VIT1/CCC1 transporter family protein [Oleisolibacter albus]